MRVVRSKKRGRPTKETPPLSLFRFHDTFYFYTGYFYTGYFYSAYFYSAMLATR